jgi:hypothetical protein
MSGIPPGLVRFCLEHTDSAELSNNPPSLSAEVRGESGRKMKNIKLNRGSMSTKKRKKKKKKTKASENTDPKIRLIQFFFFFSFQFSHHPKTTKSIAAGRRLSAKGLFGDRG